MTIRKPHQYWCVHDKEGRHLPHAENNVTLKKFSASNFKKKHCASTLSWHCTEEEVPALSVHDATWPSQSGFSWDSRGCQTHMTASLTTSKRRLQPPFDLLKLHTNTKARLKRGTHCKKAQGVHATKIERKATNRPAESTKTCHASFSLFTLTTTLSSAHGDE